MSAHGCDVSRIPASASTTGISRLLSRPTSPISTGFRPCVANRAARRASSCSRVTSGNRSSATRAGARDADAAAASDRAADLQHRRPRDAVIGEQDLARLPPQDRVSGPPFDRADELHAFQSRQERRAEAQRHDARQRFDHAVPETLGKTVPRPVAAELGTGPAAARQDDARRAELPAVVELEYEALALRDDRGDIRVHDKRHALLFEFVAQDIEHGGGLVGVRVDLPFLFDLARDAQALEERQRLVHRELFEDGSR